jgi:hypothetical protein
MQLRTDKTVRDLAEITIKTDTRDILSHATLQAEGWRIISSSTSTRT